MSEPTEPNGQEIRLAVEAAQFYAAGAEAIEQSEEVQHRISSVLETLDTIERPEGVSDTSYDNFVADTERHIPILVGRALHTGRIPHEPKPSTGLGLAWLPLDKPGEAAFLNNILEAFGAHTGVGDEPDKVLTLMDLDGLSFARLTNDVEVYDTDVFGEAESRDNLKPGQPAFVVRDTDDGSIGPLYAAILPTNIDGVHIHLRGGLLDPEASEREKDRMMVDLVMDIREIMHMGEEAPVPDTVPEEWTD